MTWLSQQLKLWSQTPRRRDLLLRLVTSTDDKTTLVDDVLKLNERRRRQRPPRTFGLATFLFLYVGVTTLYTTIIHVLPFQYRSYQTKHLVAEQLICLFCAGQCLLNWLLTRYDTSSFTQNTSLATFVPRDEHKTTEEQRQGGEKLNHLGWTYCKKCERWTPPRCHHCPICDHCILKRDHHCYFTGACVGYRNQRYFVVLLVYITLCMLWYTWSMYEYVQSGDHGYQISWRDYMPPITIWQTIFGPMPCHVMNTILYFWLCFPLLFLGPLMLLNQIFQISMGLTEYEAAQYLNIVSLLTVNQRYREVFGRYWALNLLFPMHWCFPSECDGINWPYHHDADYLTVRRIKEV